MGVLHKFQKQKTDQCIEDLNACVLLSHVLLISDNDEFGQKVPQIC